MIKYIHISEADTRGAQLASTSPPPTHSFRLSKFFFSEQLALPATTITTTTHTTTTTTTTTTTIQNF